MPARKAAVTHREVLGGSDWRERQDQEREGEDRSSQRAHEHTRHNVVTIPNNKILTDVTSCGNYGALEMQVPMDFYVGVDQDVRLAREIVLEACLTSRYVFLDRDVPILTRQVLLENVVAIHVKARPYVLDTKYEKAFETDVHLRVLEAFRQHGIRPPCRPLQKPGRTRSRPAPPRPGLIRSPIDGPEP